ncbi:hypothetical protein QFZ53_001584 [Microbacterium natoriense]|uniref:TPM domain-containing protein n=2 Tax=Microbacterium natoriense TaxID=284570 RepID=A0AAW8EVQ9_9MICO|nr:hypothetical protein [Microbacterium natoriense]
MRNRMLRAATTAGLLAVLAGLAWGSAASADTPPSLGPGYISDRSDVLSDADEAQLEQQLDELASADGAPELFVVLVPDFESPGNALAWADDTALRNNLAPDQYLLAIATDGRSLAISAEYGGDGVEAGPLSESRILEIEDRLGSEYLSGDDWAGGIGYVADEFSKTPWPWWVWVLGLVVLALIVFAVTRLVVFLRRRAALAAELRTLDGQKKRTAQRLVQADEAVRTSEQELGFVTAEFGEETTAEFADVLAENRARLQRGFQILEKLQDADEDTPQETRSWTDEILQLCAQIDADLDARTQKIASLRSLADGAADNLARLRSARADAALLQTEAAERLAVLAAAFPPADLVGVADNADEIGARLLEADAQLDVMQKATDGRKPRAVAQAVHEIERLLAEAKDLHDAVAAQADALAARSTVPADADTTVQADAGTASQPGESTAGATASILDQATAAVQAAEKSVQARPGQVGSFLLTRLSSAQRQLTLARDAAGTENGDLHAKAALTAAEQVQSLVGAPIAPESRRFVRPSRAAADEAVMYDSADAAEASEWRRSYSSTDSDDGMAGKAAVGGLSGGAVGFFGGLGVAADEPGVIVLFVLGGAVLGALSGAFGNGSSGGSGSSSGWGGSSRSSGGWSSGGSRSGSRSSGRSGGGSFGGGSRSSGRSGGRRF